MKKIIFLFIIALSINCYTQQDNKYLYRAKAKYYNKKYNEALSLINKAINLYPDDTYYYYWRAIIKDELKNYNSAIKDYDFSLTNAIMGYECDAYERRAMDKYKLKKYKDAITDFDSIVNKFICSADDLIYLYRGYAYKKINMIDEACADWTIARQKGNYEAYELLQKHCIGWEERKKEEKMKEEIQKQKEFNQRIINNPLYFHGKFYVYPKNKSLQWGYPGTEANSESNGKLNTDKIISKLGENCAAYYCDTLELFGYNDWYLPSINELGVIYKNKEKLGVFNERYKLYFSSTETEKENKYAYIDYNGQNRYANENTDGITYCIRRDNINEFFNKLAEEKRLKEQKLAEEREKREKEEQIKHKREIFENSDYGRIKKYIKSNYDEWAEKGQFETQSEYNERIKNESKQTIKALTSTIIEKDKNNLFGKYKDCRFQYGLLGPYDIKAEKYELYIFFKNGKNPTYRSYYTDTIHINISKDIAEFLHNNYKGQYTISILPKDFIMVNYKWKLSSTIIIFNNKYNYNWFCIKCKGCEIYEKSKGKIIITGYALENKCFWGFETVKNNIKECNKLKDDKFYYYEWNMDEEDDFENSKIQKLDFSVEDLKSYYPKNLNF